MLGKFKFTCFPFNIMLHLSDGGTNIHLAKVQSVTDAKEHV